MNSVNSHNRMAQYDCAMRPTKHYVNLATWGSVLVIILSAAACGPRVADDAGDSFGDTATSDTGTGELGDGDGDPGEPPIPSGETRCVERDPGVVTCWVEWEAAKARILLPCETETAMSAGVWGPAYDDVLEYWGPVSCHDISSTDNRFCLYSGARVLLTETTAGWVPELSATVCGLPESTPCGAAPDPVEQCAEYPGSLGCECVNDTCLENLSCVQGHCTTCPPGSPGCPCDLDFCEVAICTDGVCPL